MVELLCAHLVAGGRVDLTNYPLALEQFFAHLVRSRLAERIAFTDCYDLSLLAGPTGAPMEMVNPVNRVNNVAERYTAADRDAIVEAACDALDAVTEAHHARSKGHAVELWQLVFGSSFRG